ncbi:MAG: nucleotide-binding universal stress UspA family protein [Flavobacteriales bacterium]|jgi:nucleotide-binding universal stress UspA family protein
MIKKILVPTDFSEQAENALRVAADLARKHGSEINLLHMLELPMDLVDGAYGGAKSDLPEALFFMKLAHQKFETMMSASFLDGIKTYETAEFNGAFDGIMDYAKKYDTDLIVMGSHGAKGLQEFFIGSNTEKVVRNSDIPVLVIKNRHEQFALHNFIYATDFEEENHAAFKQAIAFAKDSNVTLHMLYVNTPNNFKTTHDIEKQMKDFMSHESGFEDFTLNIYNDNKVESGVLHFAEMVNAGIIGIATHGRKGLAHFLNGSLSEGLVNHAQRPVITFKI